MADDGVRTERWPPLPSLVATADGDVRSNKIVSKKRAMGRNEPENISQTKRFIIIILAVRTRLQLEESSGDDDELFIFLSEHEKSELVAQAQPRNKNGM